MLDRDLAEIYGVSTKVLNQSVKRNIERFPSNFMFRLTMEEMKNWRSQFVTSNREKMGVRRPPYAFTEHGAMMLSSILKSQHAIEVSIQIVQSFIQLREILASNRELYTKMERMEKRYNKQIGLLFETVKQLAQKEDTKHVNKLKIGFKV